MKSAYERALDKFGPVNELTDDVKKRIADIESLFKSKIAAVDINYASRISQAETSEEAETLRLEMSREIAALKEKAQSKKDDIRRGA